MRLVLTWWRWWDEEMELRAGDSTTPCIYTCYAKFPSPSRRPRPAALNPYSDVIITSYFEHGTRQTEEYVIQNNNYGHRFLR